MDAHGPLVPPTPFNRAFQEEAGFDPPETNIGWLKLRYDQELLYMDSQLARVLETLEEQGLFDRTTIIITSDHGEAFDQHGIPYHCWTLYEELVHVPLYVKPAGGRRSLVDERRISGVGVHDLALQELGLAVEPHEVPIAGLLGEWYRWPLLPGNVELGKKIGRDMDVDLVGWLRGTVKTIVDSKGRVEAYDLALDPEELHPLPLPPGVVEKARSEADRWWERHPRDGVAVELDADTKEALEALGYGN
jgi:hypothetical protein